MAKKLNMRIPLPKQVAKVHKDKKKYSRKAESDEDLRARYIGVDCPDCGEPVPQDTMEGDVCCICNHVFINAEV